MPDTYSCISTGLYHTSIAMCMCSFIWFARTLFLNAECFVFSRSVLQDAKGSCHFHHDTIQGTVSSGNLSFQTVHKTILYLPFRFARRPFYNRQFFLGQCLLIKKCQVRFSSGAVAYVVALGDLCALFRKWVDPQIHVWSHPQHHVLEAMLVFSSIQRMTWRRLKNHGTMGVHCGWWSPIWKQQPWTLRTSRLNSEKSQITQETAWI